MFFRTLELILVFAALFFILDQIVMPAITGRPLFPMFRKKPKAVASLRKAREDFDVRNLNKQADKLRRKK